MEEIKSFEIWLEFEEYEGKPEYDPLDDFFNMQVTLEDGRKYALNVWTFNFLQRARFPWPYESGKGEAKQYLLPPDLFVEKLDRNLIEKIIRNMLKDGEMNDEWLVHTEEDED